MTLFRCFIVYTPLYTYKHITCHCVYTSKPSDPSQVNFLSFGSGKAEVWLCKVLCFRTITDIGLPNLTCSKISPQGKDSYNKYYKLRSGHHIYTQLAIVVVPTLFYSYVHTCTNNLAMNIVQYKDLKFAALLHSFYKQRITAPKSVILLSFFR